MSFSRLFTLRLLHLCVTVNASEFCPPLNQANRSLTTGPNWRLHFYTLYGVRCHSFQLPIVHYISIWECLVAALRCRAFWPLSVGGPCFGSVTLLSKTCVWLHCWLESVWSWITAAEMTERPNRALNLSIDLKSCILHFLQNNKWVKNKILPHNCICRSVLDFYLQTVLDPLIFLSWFRQDRFFTRETNIMHWGLIF